MREMCGELQEDSERWVIWPFPAEVRARCERGCARFTLAMRLVTQLRCSAEPASITEKWWHSSALHSCVTPGNGSKLPEGTSLVFLGYWRLRAGGKAIRTMILSVVLGQWNQQSHSFLTWLASYQLGSVTL